MRLRQYANKMGVSYKTAFRWWQAGKLDAYQLDTGTVIVRDPVESPQTASGIALYYYSGKSCAVLSMGASNALIRPSHDSATATDL